MTLHEAAILFGVSPGSSSNGEEPTSTFVRVESKEEATRLEVGNGRAEMETGAMRICSEINRAEPSLTCHRGFLVPKVFHCFSPLPTWMHVPR